MESIKPEKNNDSNSSNNINDQDEQSKSDDDVLGYASQYNTSNQVEDKKNKEVKTGKKEIDIRKRKYSDEPGLVSHIYKKNFILKSDIQVTRKNSDLDTNRPSLDLIEEENRKNFERKMSTPLYSYFDGSDKFLKQIHPHTIDFSKSMNFIKKEDLLNPNNNIERNNTNVPNDLNVNNNYFYNLINNNNSNDNNGNNINCIQEDNQNNKRV